MLNYIEIINITFFSFRQCKRGKKYYSLRLDNTLQDKNDNRSLCVFIIRSSTDCLNG